MRHTDEDIDLTEIEEDWIENMKRRTRLAEEKMNEDSQYPVLDYDTQQDEMEICIEDLFTARDKMVKKAAKRNPGLNNRYKASRAVGRPRQRWEDDINQFLKPEETEETKGNDLKNNDTWMRVAEDQIRWKWKKKILHEEQARKGAVVLARRSDHQRVMAFCHYFPRA